MRHWNLTYNDPNRWAEVYAISGQPLGVFEAIRAGWKGQSVGSPKAVLTGATCANLNDLLHLTSNLKWANFQRTTHGGILYFRVLLETYGMPIRKGDLETLKLSRAATQNAQLHLVDAAGECLTFEGPEDRMVRLAAWCRDAFDLK